MPLRPPSRVGASIVNPLGLIFQYDVTLSEQYGASVEWTRFEVEGGLSEISDHANQQPDTISLSGTVTDTPLGGLGGIPDRAESLRRTIDAIMKARLLVVVTTGIGTFESYGVESVNTNRTPAGGNSLLIAIQLRQIRIVQSLEVAIPPELLQPKVLTTAQDTAEAGNQAAVEVGLDESSSDILGLDIPEERDITASLLSSGIDLAAEFNFGP